NTVTYTTALISATGGSVGKFGAGTLILQAGPNYNGATVVNAGTLQYGNASSTTAFNVTSSVLLDSGTFQFSPVTADTITFGSGSGSGAVTIDRGTVKFNGPAVFAGALTFGSTTGLTAVTTTGTLDVTAAGATFGSVVARTNSTNADSI